MTTIQYAPILTTADVQAAVSRFHQRTGNSNGHTLVIYAHDPAQRPQLDGIEWRENRHLRKDTIAIETGD